MQVHTFETDDEGVDGDGKKGWFPVDACRWGPSTNPNHLEVRLAGSNVRVKVAFEYLSTDIIGICWAPTRNWRRGLDPTGLSTPSTPPSNRKRGSSQSSATKPASKKAKTPTAGGNSKSDDKKQGTGAPQRRKSVRNADTLLNADKLLTKRVPKERVMLSY